MANEPLTLTHLLGKPAFQPEKRLLRRAESLISAHIGKRRDGAPPFPVTVDDLTTLLEEHVEYLDLYEDLGAFGSSVEGVTLFSVGQKPVVKVAPELTETRHRHRLKSTLAHELGHVILHDPMFQSMNQEGLFDDFMTVRQVSYRDGDLQDQGSDLYEYQAWCFCRALLMPENEVTRLMSGLRTDHSCYSDIWQDSELGKLAIQTLASHFEVSTALVRVHLLRQGILTKLQPPESLF